MYGMYVEYLHVLVYGDLLRCLPPPAAAAHTHSPREREERDELVNRDAHQDPVGPGKKELAGLRHTAEAHAASVPSANTPLDTCRVTT